jgi:hypothetical protein
MRISRKRSRSQAVLQDVSTALWLGRRIMRMRAGRAPWQSRWRRPGVSWPLRTSR